MPSNPLTDLIPARYRLYVYRVAAALVFLYSLYLATQGDWVQFAVALVSSLVPSLAAANTAPTVDQIDTEDYDEENYLDGHGG